MATWQYRTGLHNVGSYQVSGRPWITGSLQLGVGAEDQIIFPSVTKSITVINTESLDGDLHVHFNSKTSGDVTKGMHYIPLNDNDDRITLNVKCKEIYISNPDASNAVAYTVIAELTNIGFVEMIPLTGSGLTAYDAP
tara:strand:- start:418 stop:831 length:414 start_codon:yes stop_codon:yes gene_type:complete